jgi:peptide/nickel transport system substrate-binding protein
VNILPAHIWDPNIEKARSGAISLKEPNNPWYWTPEATIGTGCFAYAEGKLEQFIRLEAAKDPWRGKPHLATILWQNVGAADTQSLAFQKGQLDSLSVQPQDLDTIAKLANVQLDGMVTPYIQILELNCQDNEFGLTDRRVRQAISAAIDRQAINDGLYHDYNESYTAILQGDWNNPQAPQFPYNPDQAKQLLQAANFDRSRELVLGCDYTDTLSQQAMQAIQANLQAVGFKTRLLFQTGSGSEETRKAGKWTTWLNAFASHYSPYVIALALRTDGAQNAGHWGSQDLDAKFTQAEAMSDQAAQKQIWADIQNVAQPEMYVVPLWRRGTKIAYQGRLHGWDKNTTGAFSMFGFHYFGAEKWDIV